VILVRWTPPQPAGDMLEAGGTCEFSAQTLRSDRRGAHVSPASARASDPAAPPSGIAPASDDAASPMRTGKTHRLKTCATWDTQVANLCYVGHTGCQRVLREGAAPSLIPARASRVSRISRLCGGACHFLQSNGSIRALGIPETLLLDGRSMHQGPVTVPPLWNECGVFPHDH